ncbi:MAG: hypothetical protein A2X12_06175 [Bacteroidetes bacterium GWE2_29_8]|nr:MAG: hypothetical protein A2X12_06175 [Bacteroidetes bacterium GWE2_29_8]OFY14345.1 MAG: hypothetical protein A2X02_05025 [Bacteroidetes bacterium GWF2_29_10]
MLKTLKNKSLTEGELKFNKLISKTRYIVERTFGSIRRWFSGGTARYIGLAKMHTRHLMEAIAILYQTSGILLCLIVKIKGKTPKIGCIRYNIH